MTVLDSRLCGNERRAFDSRVLDIGACRGAKPLCVTLYSPFLKGGYRGIGPGVEEAGTAPLITAVNPVSQNSLSFLHALTYHPISRMVCTSHIKSFQ